MTEAPPPRDHLYSKAGPLKYQFLLILYHIYHRRRLQSLRRGRYQWQRPLLLLKGTAPTRRRPHCQIHPLRSPLIPARRTQSLILCWCRHQNKLPSEGYPKFRLRQTCQGKLNYLTYNLLVVCLSIRLIIRYISVFYTFLYFLLRRWLEIWKMILSRGNIYGVWLLLWYTFFWRSYWPLLR